MSHKTRRMVYLCNSLSKVLLYWVAGFCCGTFFTCRQAQAATTYAVLVGISDYKITDYRNGDLRYADQDARRFGAFLRSKAGGNVPPQNIKLLTDQAATKAAILNALRLFQKAGPQDRVLFYFSGHGLQGGFVPYDISLTDARSMLSYREVKAGFKSSAAATKLCIGDACLSGGMTARSTWNPPASHSSPASNVVLMLSSRSTQQSVESGQVQGGLFTFFMLDGLKGKADRNRNGIVTIKELFGYVSPRIKRTTPNHQSPVFYGTFSDDLTMSIIEK